MSGYNLDRLVKLTTLMSRPVDQDVLFETALKESMIVGNCDGGTIYTIEGNKLHFRYVYTLSRGIAINYKSGAGEIPPVSLNKKYASAYAVIKKVRLNIKDVYVSEEFDFTGAREYDKRNQYRTCSMLVVPMLVGAGEVFGVLQLINAKDKYGMWTPFTKEQEELVSAIGSITALYLENLKLKGMLADISVEKKEENKDEKKDNKKEATKKVSTKEENKKATNGEETKKEEKKTQNSAAAFLFMHN